MLHRIQALLIGTALALLSGCYREPEPPPPPEIVSFSADKHEANPGEPVTLSYEVNNASELTLMDDTGAFITLNGDVEKGVASVTPLRTHFYVLQATGPGGRETAFVQVAVAEPLKEVFLVAAPPLLNGGEKTQLLWSAFRNKSAKITSSFGESFALTGESGAIDVTPLHSGTYTLTADPGTGAPDVAATVEVKVRPVAQSLSANPSAAHAGETMMLSWTTRGATRVVVSEKTFGAITASTDTDGSFAWTVPTTLPSGLPVQDGLPLELTLRAFANEPDSVASITIPAFVGIAPAIEEFEIPAFVTKNQPFIPSWHTSHASRVTLFADGAVVFQTLPNDSARVVQGSVSLPAPSKTTSYVLVAEDDAGLKTSRTVSTTPVAAPELTDFQLTPDVGPAGSLATASWKSVNATRVTLRTRSGVTAFNTVDAAKVANGSAQLAVGQSTEYTLEAWNLAGQKVALTRQVTAQGALATADAKTSISTLPIAFSWDFTSAGPGSAFGMPQATPLVVAPSADFIDLRTTAGATTLTFLDRENGVRRFVPGQGFAFPFLGKTYGAFYVSVDGLVGLSPVAANGEDNVDISKALLGEVLAPFWDTLQLGSGGDVRAWVKDDSYPRKLVIQWSDVSRSYVADSHLTFEVQLFESGEFHFVYETLQGTGASGESATIGVQSLNAGFNAQHPSNAGTAAVAEQTELSWFSSSNASGSFGLEPLTNVNPSVVSQLSDGHWLVTEAPVTVFAPQRVLITEAMPIPETAFAAKGQWVELFNAGSEPVDLAGLALESTGSTQGGFVFPSTILPPGGTVVVGQSTDPLENDEANVSLAYQDVPLASGSEQLTLSTSNAVLASFVYGAPQAGHSVQSPQPFAFSGPGTVAQLLNCAPTNVAFNSAQTAFGTPGKAFDCLPYRVSQIPSRYRDISSTGAPLFAALNGPDYLVTQPLSPSFPYFGIQHPNITVSQNGWLAFGANPAVVGPQNRVVPDTNTAGTPQGAIAPFWDDLQLPLTTASNVWMTRMEPGADPLAPMGHWIFDWTHATHFDVLDDINFEVKLFDDGAIEFHYGTLVSGGINDYASGSSATVWMEQPGFAKALAVCLNQPRLLPNTAYRFTPVP